ncbi:MAG: tetratricopeptide repeat protein [Candidatus Paracaedibacteraceae bacterium]|nr:tetratricopeptide repeat protein [Candidatus Paracaedibacteraceae bacterium]
MKNTNFQSKFIHPLEIYLEYLTTINAAPLTQREIDVISCLLNGRNTKGIANFLSISPKTVATHLYNATRRFGCDSNGMMKLIENSDQFLILKEYYSTLLIDSLFKKTIQEIFKRAIDNPTSLKCVLIYWKKKPPFLKSLKDDLTKAGLTISLEGRKETQSFGHLIQEIYHDTCPIYFLPNMLMETQQTQLMGQELDQSSDPRIFFLPKTAKSMVTPQGISQFTFINPSEWYSYYSSVFVILKKILPTLDLDCIFAQFEERANALCKSPFSIPTQSLPKNTLEGTHEKEERVFQIRKLATKKAAYALVGSLSISLLFFWGFNRDHINVSKPVYYQKLAQGLTIQAVRSDLAIPSEATLLNRSDLIVRIEDKLKKQQEGIQTIALIGIGGGGKTTLARQYARSQKSPVVWEISAETQESLRTSFENLAYSLAKMDGEKKVIHELQNIRNSNERGEKIIQFVKEHLKAESNWVLIYDNVEQFSHIQKYFPSDPNVWGNGKVIITTRDSHIQNNIHIHLTISIGELDPIQKLNLFLKIITQNSGVSLPSIDKKEAEIFLNNIPPFPLDVVVAAYYLKATNTSYQDYLARLGKSHREFLEMQKSLLKESTEYINTRHSIISLSLKNIIAKNKDFLDLFVLIGLLGSDAIPRNLLDHYKDPLVVDRFISCLKKYSLIVNPVSQSSTLLPNISIHRSTQAISISYLSENLKLNKDSPLLKEIVCVLNDYLEQVIEAEDAPKMQLMVAHLAKFLDNSNLLADISQGLLRSRLGCIYYFLNNDKSLQVIQDSLKHFRTASLKTLSSEDELRVARSFLHIGAVYTELRFYKEAQESLEKAVKIYRDGKLKNDVELSWALSHLGNLYRRQGNYEKARDCLEKSVHLNKQYGADNKRMVRTLSCLGSVYRGLGSYQKSIEILEESLRLCKKHYPEDHFRIGRVLKSLGNLYRRLGDYKQAKKYLEKSLLIYEKYFPESHINIGLILAYLGNCLRELGDYEKSRNYLEQSLKVHQKHFDENHAVMGWIMFHLARTYKALGKHQESHKLFDKVLKIYGNGLKEENIETACLLRDIAEIYLEKNRLEDAEDFIKRSLNILEYRNHVEAYKSREVLGEIYFKRSFDAKSNQERQDLQNQALNQFTGAIKMIEQHFPKTSAHIQRILSKIKRVQEERA